MTLSRKINSIIVFAITSIITMMGFWEIAQIRNQLKLRISQSHTNIVNRLILSLSDPLWNMDFQIVQEVVFSEMQEEDVISVTIFNENKMDNIDAINFSAVRIENSKNLFVYKAFNYLSYDETGSEIFSYKELLDGHFKRIARDPYHIVKFAKIFKKDVQIAVLKVVMTERFVNDRIQTLVWQLVVKLGFILLIIIGLLGFLLNKNILKPIIELTRQTNIISQGNLNQEILHHSRKDEIGELASRFNIMRDSVREKITNLNKEIAIRKQTEIKLRESENKYAKLFNKIADPVIIADPVSLAILGHNTATVDIYGWTSEELHSMNLCQLHPDIERKIILKNFNNNTLSPKSDFTHYTKKGDCIFVELHSSAIEYEGKPAWLTIIRNITYRKQVEAELKKHRDHLEEMVQNRTAELENEIDERLATERSLLRITKAIESATDAIVLAESDGEVFYTNRSFEKLFGYDLSEIQMNDIRFIFKHHSQSQEIFKTIANGDEWTGEVEMLSKSESLIPAFIRANAVKDPAGKIIGLIGIFTDITIRKKAEKKLQETQKQVIENAHRAGMADIATGTLHNVGNLLNSVKTSSRVMLDILQQSAYEGLQKANGLLAEHTDNFKAFISKDPKGIKLLQYYLKIGDNFIKEHKELIHNNERLSEKIDTIADVIAAQQSFAGAGALIEDQNLENIINSAIIMQQGTIERYQITIKKDYQNIPNVPVQKTKLVHILVNLIQNAKDAILANQQSKEKMITLSTYQEKYHVIIQFSDTGIGISHDDLKRIFNMGFTTKKNGHGFGLHSSANYMTEMKGEMWAESPGKNKGSSFFLKFNLPKNKHEKQT